MSPSRKRRLALVARTWTVPVLLVLVACVHMRQWHQQSRSSWGTGAGFGMFATVDYHGSRFFRCYADTEAGRIRIELPSEINGNDELLARAFPSAENLSRIVDELIERDLFLNSDPGDGFGASFVQNNSETQPLRINALQLEIWGLKMDRRNKQLKSYKINELKRTREKSTGESYVASH